jgi:hypothetical protein
MAIKFVITQQLDELVEHQIIEGRCRDELDVRPYTEQFQNSHILQFVVPD